MSASQPFRSLVLTTLTGLALVLSATTGCDSESSQVGTQKADPSAAPPTPPNPTASGAKKTPKAATEQNPKPVE